MTHADEEGHELRAARDAELQARKVAEAKAGGDSRPTVNEQLVERGLARVPGASKHAADDLAVAMRALQLGARAARAGVWRYGDCDFSDDEK